MRNPKAHSFLSKLFGKPGGVIELGSFRPGWMHARAVRSALPGATEEELKFLLAQDRSEDGQAFVRNSLIVDQTGLT